jgi:hypothetical protein
LPCPPALALLAWLTSVEKGIYCVALNMATSASRWENFFGRIGVHPEADNEQVEHRIFRKYADHIHYRNVERIGESRR